MALISCPECRREISDQVQSCPHCGYPIRPAFSPKTGKKPIQKKALIFVLITMALMAGVLLTVDQFVWKPARIYSDALNTFERGDYQQASQLFSEISSYQDAASYLLKANEQVAYENALALAEEGKYSDAVQTLDDILSNDKAKMLKEQLYFESYAFSAITDLINRLKNPESFILNDIAFYYINDNYKQEPLYPACIIRSGGQNGLGGVSTGYVLYEYDNYNTEAVAYTYVGACDTLDISSYDENDVEWVDCLLINLVMEQGTQVGTVDLNRMRHLIETGLYLSVPLLEPFEIPAGET